MPSRTRASSPTPRPPPSAHSQTAASDSSAPELRPPTLHPSQLIPAPPPAAQQHLSDAAAWSANTAPPPDSQSIPVSLGFHSTRSHHFSRRLREVRIFPAASAKTLSAPQTL